MRKLKDTVVLMTSEDYKERFRAEVLQVGIRARKLSEMLDMHRKGKLDFAPACPVPLLEAQLAAMYTYLGALISRAEIEGIHIPEL